MKTYYVFQSQSSPDLRGFTDDASGSTLPAEEGPWVLAHQIAPDAPWDVEISRAVVATGIRENGFYLSGARTQRTASKRSSRATAWRAPQCSILRATRSAPSNGLRSRAERLPDGRHRGAGPRRSPTFFGDDPSLARSHS
jgi:hypothetical protein